MQTALTVVADFNETVVRERVLPAWCLDRLRRGPAASRLAAALDVLLLGPLSVAADRLGLGALAARVGFLAFRGVPASDLAAWAGRRLTPNEAAHAALDRLGGEAGELRLVVVSRGTPALAVRAHLERPEVRDRLARAGVRPPVEVRAPEVDCRGGVLTGRVAGDLPTKSGRLAHVPDGAVFLGDVRDERWVRRSQGRFRFERI